MISDSGSLVGKRLREARKEAGLPQDKLGIAIGIDEHSASTRISRYETGVHEPPFGIVQALAKVLKTPTAYFYCSDEQLARVIKNWQKLTAAQREAIASTAEPS
ncbi:helix-turn-helix domain-containing protein [Bordetella sp. N]|uniref:helix-turn-helix domain-containing protein n=1 Tax=Bordetella sp. N TaxID=1746199 RepID=UPI0009EC58F5|nr:helix-turn-helix transcriptional regulator [Bordetella sp. N]